MRSTLLLSILALILLAGCGGGDDGRVPTYRAAGVVQFPDGKPLAGGIVLCESPHGLAAKAIINDDGTFRLGTYDKADGAVEGRHRATIQPSSTLNPNSDTPNARRPLIDDRFKSFDTSGIVFEVKPDGDNYFKIEVAAPPD